MNNPYKTPNETVEDERDAFARHEYKVRRWGRVKYLCFILLSMPFTYILYSSFATSLISFYYRGVSDKPISDSTWIFISIYFGAIAWGTSYRCRDANISGWLSVLIFIPLVNVVLAVVLMLIPGTNGVNEYGEKPAMFFNT